VDVSFYGVRGSTPCSCTSVAKYGGNTSCVVVTPDHGDPIILDLGTGLRYFGLDCAGLNATGSKPFVGSAFVTHLHWDHIQGLPFFAPVLCSGGEIDVYAPPQLEETTDDAVRRFLAPPFFPVSLDDLPGDVTISEMEAGAIDIAGATVTADYVPHMGPTFGYRIEADGFSVAYIPDHQQPLDDSTVVAPEVLKLCEGVDLLIHDAQFNSAEFAIKAHWGHCTPEYAMEVAAQAEAKCLALFHHDPSHSDTQVDEMLAETRVMGEKRGVTEVIAAHEGLTISYSSGAAVEQDASRSVEHSTEAALT